MQTKTKTEKLTSSQRLDQLAALVATLASRVDDLESMRRRDRDEIARLYKQLQSWGFIT